MIAFFKYSRVNSILRTNRHLATSSGTAIIHDDQFAVPSPIDGLSPRQNNKTSAFPWRDRPEKTTSVPYLLQVWKKNIGDAFLMHIFSIDNHMLQKERIDGVQKAFQTVSQTIFSAQSDALQTTALTDIMDRRLASFYHDAIQATRRDGLTVFHSLHSVGQPTVTNCDLIVAGKRDSATFENLELTRPFFGLFGWYIIPKLPPTGDITYEKWDNTREMKTAHADIMRMRNINTIRYSFDVPCEETFWVKDGERIIQGDEKPRACVHEVLLECCVTLDLSDVMSGMHTCSDFNVVDIDGWLEGNMFWLADKRNNTQKK